MTRLQELTIPSDPEELPKVDEIAEKVAIEMKFPKDLRDDIAIAVTEAVNNAIIHGNHEDPDKKVHITFTSQPDGLKVRVIDEGDGFDPDKMPDPTTPENILLEQGRGVFIIKHLMDYTEFKKVRGGMQITMVKKHKK
ncbi:MAG: ATP-binding protein [FCB group bacterium]|nr:ATP-binding protein [FCB group bacterium]